MIVWTYRTDVGDNPEPWDWSLRPSVSSRAYKPFSVPPPTDAKVAEPR
jgi:hypothetical protein